MGLSRAKLGSMSNPPRIWLDYRPIRIGWVVDEPSIAVLGTAAEFNTCLWGGRYNPIIPCREPQLAPALVKLFNVDVLVPVHVTKSTTSFIDGYPHLRLSSILHGGPFDDRHCAFVDVRHAVSRASRMAGFSRGKFYRPIWTDADPLAPLLPLIFGRYPSPPSIKIDYARGVRSELEIVDFPLGASTSLAPELHEHKSCTPLSFTGFDLTVRHEISFARARCRLRRCYELR